jgi:class 3 adenylate cyclase/tetratricopeptide (TPR) repeat protein
MSRATTCLACREQALPLAHFCHKCGAPLQASCETCGTGNPPSARFCMGCGGNLGSAAAREAQAPAASVASVRKASAERRQLTVVFCDLVGSTALAKRLDPEEMRDLIVRYRLAAAGIVTGFGGTIAQYLGDGILAYFGYPAAHEDDAERAVRAGLDIIQAAGQLGGSMAPGLSVRVGIATGLVVVGDQIGAAMTGEKSAVGDAPNVAARLQALAEPNSVVIAGSTRRLLGRLFDLVEINLPGPENPGGLAKAFRVLRPSAIESRFEALRGAAQSAFIGRGEEIDLLMRRWRQAERGEGKVVLLSGQPGIGKSRILNQMLNALKGARHFQWRYYCSSLHSQSALFPFIIWIERAAGIASTDTKAAKLAKIKSLLHPAFRQGEENIALFADLLSVADIGPSGVPKDPQQKKEATLRLLHNNMIAISDHAAPIVIIVEDAHWLDPTSAEILDRIINQISSRRVLLVMSARPEYQPSWIDHPEAAMISLTRFGKKDSEALIAAQAGGKALPIELRDQILAQADGIPLFIEELTRALLESGSPIEDRSGLETPSILPGIAVPISLQASLIARLDRLGDVKEIAQIGAAIGREFSHQLLQEVAGTAEPELVQGLAKLNAAGVIQKRGAPPDETYIFKHALIQDAAYQTLLKSRRRELHAAIASALAEKFPAAADSQPEIVAHHYAEAAMAREAVAYWLKAGKLAAAKSASQEAVAHLDRGLDLLKTLPRDEKRDHLEVSLERAKTPNIIALRSFKVLEIHQAYERERKQMTPDTPDVRRRLILSILVFGYFNFAQYQDAYETAEELLAAAQNSPDLILACTAHAACAISSNAMAQFAKALHHANEALVYYNAVEKRPNAWHYVWDFSVVANCAKGLASWHLGGAKDAETAFAEARRVAEASMHANTIGHACAFGGMIPAFFAQDYAALRSFAERCETIGKSHDLPQWLAWATCMIPAAMTPAEATAPSALHGYRQGLQMKASLRDRMYDSVFFAAGAVAYGHAGQIKEALDCIERGLRHSADTGERWADAELWRLAGDLHLRGDPANAGQAEGAYRQAIAIAESHNALMLWLRCATSLAQLLQTRSQTAEAMAILKPIIMRFTPENDTADLRRAQRLVEELEPSPLRLPHTKFQ